MAWRTNERVACRSKIRSLSWLIRVPDSYRCHEFSLNRLSFTIHSTTGNRNDNFDQCWVSWMTRALGAHCSHICIFVLPCFSWIDVFERSIVSRPNMWPRLVFSEFTFQHVAPKKRNKTHDFSIVRCPATWWAFWLLIFGRAILVFSEKNEKMNKKGNGKNNIPFFKNNIKWYHNREEYTISYMFSRCYKVFVL